MGGNRGRKFECFFFRGSGAGEQFECLEAREKFECWGKGNLLSEVHWICVKKLGGGKRGNREEI